MDATFNKLQIILYEKFSFHYDYVQLETKLELELGMDSREMFELLNEIKEKMYNPARAKYEYVSLTETFACIINDMKQQTYRDWLPPPNRSNPFVTANSIS